MREALQEEIQLTMERQGRNYGEWIKGEKDKRHQVQITFSFDMGWQKRSSGNCYDSLSGHVFMIGAESCEIIHCVVTSKMCPTVLSAKINMIMSPRNTIGQRTRLDP